MIVAYSISLAGGLVIFGWWIVAERTRGGASWADNIRRAITALIAFGMGGLSASYSGLNDGVSAVLAFGAVVALIIYTDRVSADADR